MAEMTADAWDLQEAHDILLQIPLVNSRDFGKAKDIIAKALRAERKRARAMLLARSKSYQDGVEAEIEAFGKELDWKQRTEAAEAHVKALEDALEQDRTTVADGISAIKKALAAREWLRLGRGSFEWDDDRWKDEFGAAYDEILEAIEPLRRVASNWQDCPEKHSEIMKARQALAQEQDDG